MKVHVPSDETSALARLAAQVDRVEREVAGMAVLRADIAQHGQALRRLSEVISQQATASRNGRKTRADGGPAAANGAGGKGSGPNGAQAPGASADGEEEAPERVREWMTVTRPELAVQWLAEVTVWVRRVWSRYQELPECWPWHECVVAELLASQACWVAAIKPDTRPESLAAWHDRWRPSAASRIAKTLTGCMRAGGLHVTGITRWEVDPTVLDELAVWWATTHGTGPKAPGLTPAQEGRR